MKYNYPFLDLATTNQPMMADLVAAATRVITSGRYIGGSEVEAFEQELAGITHTEFAVGLSNGMDALRLSLRALVNLGRLKEGDAVIVQANTFIASVLAITDAGLEPWLVDIDSVTLQPSVEQIEDAARRGAKAFMPVHLYGTPVWNDEIKSVVERFGLWVVEDNAQAIGATASASGLGSRGSVTTGSLGHVGAMSFYPTKNIGALGDAGAVTTDDPEIAAMVRTLANYGSDRRYHNIVEGFNCRLDPIQAAMLRVKLGHLDEEISRRRAIAESYCRNIMADTVSVPALFPGSVWHQYVISTPRRDELQQWLADNGVSTDIHYATPPHQQPCYSNTLGHLQLQATELAARSILSLPVGNHIKPDDAAIISQIINQFH